MASLTSIPSVSSSSTSLGIHHNLPTHTTPFIGRTQDLNEITLRLKDPDCRLLTLIGPCGIGKTRLALQAAQQLVDESRATNEMIFQDGIFFIPLQTVTEATEIVPTIAEEFDLRFYGDTSPFTQLLEHRKEKELLLILDNFEHLLDGVTILLDLLIGASKIKILAGHFTRGIEITGGVVSSDYRAATSPFINPQVDRT